MASDHLSDKPDGNQQPEVSIWVAGPGDLHRVERLLRTAPREIPAWPQQIWKSFLVPAGPDETIGRLLLLAGLEGSADALLVATILQETSELELLLVAPDARRNGIGRRLSGAWMAWAAGQGAREGVLEVRAANAPARALYEQLGFGVQGVRRGYYREPVDDAVLMRKGF